MKTKKRQTGFTLIEMVVTMMIMLILASLATGSILRTQPRYRVRGDTWTVYQTLTKAKFLSIDGNRTFGVLFYHVGTHQPDYFFVFQDWNNDGVFNDTDGNPLNQCNPATTSGCLDDPIMGAYEPLHSSNFFPLVFGVNMTTPGSISYITFGPLGNVRQTPASRDIYIQSYLLFDRVNNLSYRGGDKVDFASGNASRLPLAPATMPTMP